MPPTIRTAFLALLVAIAAPASAQEPSYFGLRFPDMVAGFPRGDINDFEKDHPGLGYGVRYNGNGWVINVFIYDDGIKDIPDDVTADVAGKQFAQARGDIYARMAQSKGNAVDRARFAVPGRDQKTGFVCGAYLLSDRGRQIDSFLCLTVWHHKFVKYRLSTLSNGDSTAAAKRFVAAWAPILWP